MPGLVHFNNAIVYARAADHPPGLVDDDKPMFGADYLARWRPGDATFDNDYCQHPQYSLMARLSGGAVPKDNKKPPMFKDPEGYVFAPDTGSPLLGKGKRKTIDLPDGGHWTIPDELNLGAFGDNDRPHALDKLGCPANGGKAGPEWATPRDGSVSFPPENPPEKPFVAVP